MHTLFLIEVTDFLKNMIFQISV